MQARVAVLLLALATVALCDFSFLERTPIAGVNRFYNPEKWSMGGAAPDNGEISFHIFMVESNLERLNEEFLRRTTPGSPLWRHWLTLDQVKQITATPEEEKRIVKLWLSTHGASTVIDFHDALKVTTTVEVAERLFQTEFYTFTHIASNTIVFRQMGEYSIPSILTSTIEFVTGISEFPFAARKLGASRGARDDINGKVVPYVIDQLYAVPWADKLQVTPQASVGVIEFQGDDSFAQSDLSTFQQQNNLAVQPVPTSQIVGPYKPNIPDAEATLDIQYAWGVSYNTSAWYWTVEGWMLEWAVEFQQTAASGSVPQVVSMSWGWTENNQCEIAPCSNSQDYVTRVNSEFQKIVTTGVTITASSGDQGAPGDGDPNCLSKTAPVSSIFPGSSPYVLSIGATMLVTPTAKRGHANPPSSFADQPVPPICNTYTCADTTTTQEVACSTPTALITTGGGFSNYVPTPSWQQAVVSNYFNLAPASELPPTGTYNPQNRGFPDVSALGHNYMIYREGRWEDVDGTSCSSPVWAGLISLFNDYEIKAGRPTLGFINPLVYQAYASSPSSFNDIVNGNNDCSESKCCDYGYPTVVGWDPVTGLGSPNFPDLYAYIQSQSTLLYREQ